MSESIPAPAAPAAAPPAVAAPPPAAPTPAPTQNTPPPSSQPAISVSEAARLLGRHRADIAGQVAARANPVQQGPGESRPNGAAPGAPQIAPGSGEAQPTSRGLSAMERALGVPEGAAASPSDAPGTGADIVVGGERYSEQQLRDLIERGQDYTKKTQEVAERARALQAQQESLAQVLPYIQPELARLQALVDGVQRPDVALLQADPAAYFQQLHAYESSREEQARLGGLTQLQQQAAQRALAQQVEVANQALTKELPFWSDPAERAKAQADIVEWATSKGGFSRDELRGLADHRQLMAMMKAAAFDRWVAGAKTTPAMPQIAAAPARGSAPPAAPTARIAQAEAAFEANPNIRNAAALIGARRGT